MPSHICRLRILRFVPGHIDPPTFHDYEVRAESGTTVLDALETIRLTQEPGLMYRHCCHHASCGTCACMINGTPALACTTRLVDIDNNTITLEPLANHPCIGDLAVATTGFFADFDPDWATVRETETASAERTPSGVKSVTRFENCIECGCCTAACPIASHSSTFQGPAALAAINAERRNRPQRETTLVQKAAQPNGASLCQRHLACSRACPSKVYPARHIADLLRVIDVAHRAPR